jgi:hypothetical protein
MLGSIDINNKSQRRKMKNCFGTTKRCRSASCTAWRPAVLQTEKMEKAEIRPANQALQYLLSSGRMNRHCKAYVRTDIMRQLQAAMRDNSATPPAVNAAR